ncbi:tenomodulin isoform X2 [Vanacampus margaritifer]
MEASKQSSSQQVLYNDVEGSKEKRTKYRMYQRLALILAFVFLLLGLCVFSLAYLWSPTPGKITQVDAMDNKMEDSLVWVPSEEPIVDPAFLFQSKIWEFCQELPIHWIHPSPLSDSELEEEEVEHVDAPDTEVKGHRSAREVEYPPVNDYRAVGLELDNRLDERGYCCQYCHQGYRFCRRYHVPLGGFNPWPYYYRGGHVVCQVVMPCNWWIARMLGRI